MKKFKVNHKIFILVVLSALTFVNIISFASKFSTKEIKGESVLYKMFIETEPGSGEYQPSSAYVFPTSGYSLDMERTTCTNGGTVSQTSDFKINYIGSTNNCTFYFKRINTSNTISVVARSLTYNGLDQELVTVSNSQGVIYYSTTNALNSTNYTSGSTDIPTGKNTGNYTVYFYTPGNTSYNSASGNVPVSINNYTPQITLEEKSSGHTGSAVAANTAVVSLVNGETYNGTITYTYYNGETCQGTPLSGPPNAVGNYSVKASTEAFANYNASTSDCVKHTIVKNSTAAEGSCGNLTYNGNQQTLAQGGQHVIYTNNYGTAAGEYTVTVTAEQNYTFNDGTEQKTLTCSIAPKQLTPSVTSQNKEYDGSTDAVCNVSLTGIVGSDVVTASAGSHSFANADVGNGKTVTCSDITLDGASVSNYTLNATTKTTTANITAKSIYVTWGSDTTFTYDGNIHGPTVITPISGVYGETINLTRTTQTNVGNYTSTASCSSVTGGRAKCTNYTLTNQIKAFTITGKTVQYTSSNYSGAYDGASHTFTLNATEPTSGNTIYYSTSAAFTASTCDSNHGSTTKPTAKNVSDSKTVYWCIKPSNTNYNTAVGSNSITISRKELTNTQITNYSTNLVSGATTYSRNVSTGVGSETVSLTYTPYENTAGTYTFATTAASGKYTLSQSNNNYSIGSAGSFTINAVSCAAPTNLAVSNTGEVTWTASSNCSNAQYQISIDGTNYTAATSGIDYNSTITSATGSRTVHVKTVAPNSNYNDSTDVTTTVTVYSVTLSKGTGISAVSGAGNYISGRSVTIDATVSTGYTWSKWTQSSGGAQVSTTKSYSVTVNGNLAYTANAVDSAAPSVTITRNDYNTFTWSANDNKGVTGYAITNSSTEPTSWTTTGTLTSGTYDVSSANTWYVWAKDQAGNTSSANIKSYTISRSQGTGTTLTTRYDSTSSSSGTAFTNSTVMLAGTSVWAKSEALDGYHTPTLKHGNTTMTASGSSFTVSATETINSTASSNQVTIEVYLNDDYWDDSGMTIALYNGSTPTNYIAEYHHDVLFYTVANGTYNVYASKSDKQKNTLVDTGIDVVVNNSNVMNSIDYYTVTVFSGGNGIGIEDVYGSGTYLAGQTVQISATVEPYSHTWDGWSGSGDHLYNESYDNYEATAYCTVTQESSYLPRTYYTSSASITREDYNTFSYDISGWHAYAYYVSTSSTKPNRGQASSSFALNTWTTATTTGNLNLTAGTTYYVWAEDDPTGSVSDNYATITTYSYTGTAGTGSSLSVKYENSSGTTAPISGVVLEETPLYLQATANIGYINPVLKQETSTITNPTTVTIYENTTFSSSATAESHVYEISSGTYGYAPDLATAISRANAGATIKALSNNSTSGQTISKNLTINTNGKTITVSSGQIIVSSGKTLTVDGTGKIYSTVDTDTISVNGTLNWYNATLQNTARTAIANGGTTNIYSGTIRGYTHGIYANGTTNISDTSNIYSDSSTSGYGIKVVSGKNVTISGSPTIKGYYGIYNQGTTTVQAGATPNIRSDYNNAIYNDTSGTITLKNSSSGGWKNAYIEATNINNGSNAIVNYGTIQIGSHNTAYNVRGTISGNLYNIASASGYALYNGGTGNLYDFANYYVASGHKTVYSNSSLTLYAGLFAYNNSGIDSAFQGTKTNVGTWGGMSYSSYTMYNTGSTLQTNYASYRVS